MQKLQGWRTILTGLAIAVGVPGLSYLAGVDWTQYVSGNTALMISGGLTVALRVVTKTSVFSKE